MTEPALSIRNLSKSYKLGTIGRHTLVDEATHLWHQLRGRDPRQHMGKIGYTATEARRVASEQAGAQEFWALKDVAFDVQPGEVVGLIGRNGAGKSTLLKILSRITEPTSGAVTINGRIGSLLEVGTGFHPELTGRENVYMNGTILGMKKREIDARFDEIVAFAEIEQFLDTPVKRYSSGMYVRLAFAVAAHLESEILLVDEVLAVGDVEFQNKCLGKMSDVASQGRTVLLVSHNMAAVENLCPRVILLENGRMIEDGGQESVLASYLQRGAHRESADIDLSIHPERAGSGAVRAVHLRILDGQGRPIRQIKSGMDCTFEMTVENHAPGIQAVIAGIRFHDHLLKDLFQCRSDITQCPFDCATGKTRLACRIRRLPLQAGTYPVSIGLIASGDLADRLDYVVQLSVESGDFYGTGRLPNRLKGSFLADYEWAQAGNLPAGKGGARP